jgi:hypothetical protein
LKSFLSILISIGILLQANSAAVIIADFYLHRDYIAKNLCENRNKPQMKCCGKCCLKRKLAKDAKEQVPGPRNQKNEQVVNLFFNNTRLDLKTFRTTSVARQYFSYNDMATISFQGDIFHPPTA